MSTEDFTGEFLYRTAVHLALQGRRASRDGCCMLRTPDGLKCAIGYWIPDDLYDPSMEMNFMQVAIELSPVLASTDVSAIEQMRIFHDWTGNWECTPDVFVRRLFGVIREHISLLDDGLFLDTANKHFGVPRGKYNSFLELVVDNWKGIR